MKKIVIAFVFLISSLTMSQAQVSVDDVRFGFQLSPAISWTTTNTNRINSSGSNFGLKLGMMGEYNFGENYAITSGLGFHFNAGGTLLHDFEGQYWTRTDLPSTLDTLAAGSKLKYNIQYLEIPLGLKMRTREMGFNRYYLEPNVLLGIKTQARGDLEGPGIGGEQEEYNIKDEVNALNLSWGIGAGIERNISSSTTLVVGLNVQIGFTDMTDDNGVVFDENRGWPDSNPQEQSKGKINALTLKVGILF